MPNADEFDFHVANLAVDLRDGVRLTRLVEVVTGDWGLTTGLRVPAVSRLQVSACDMIPAATAKFTASLRLWFL